MKKSFSITIALSGKQLLTYEAKQLTIPSNNGHLGVMAGRQPLLATIEAGIIIITDIEDNRHHFGVTGGFCEMLDNHATLLCDSLISIDEIDMSGPLSDIPVFRRDTARMSEMEKVNYVTTLLHQKLKRTVESNKVKNTQEPE